MEEIIAHLELSIQDELDPECGEIQPRKYPDDTGKWSGQILFERIQ